MATRPRTENNPFAYGMRLLAVFYNEMEKNKDKISFIKSYQEIEKNSKRKYAVKIVIVLTIAAMLIWMFVYLVFAMFL